MSHGRPQELFQKDKFFLKFFSKEAKYPKCNKIYPPNNLKGTQILKAKGDAYEMSLNKYLMPQLTFLKIDSGLAKLDGKTCQDINECAIDTSLCSGGICINTEGSFTCRCPNGKIQ